MTVSNLNTRTDATGDGSTTVFSYNFDVRREQDVAAYLDGVEESSFSVDLINRQVTFVTPPGNGVLVTLIRETALTQQTDYTEYDAFPAETHESGLDQSTLQDQELDERLDRTLGYGVVDAPDGGSQLPAPEANKGIGYDENGELANLTIRLGTGDPVENPLLEDLFSGGFQYGVSESGKTGIGGLSNSSSNVALDALNDLIVTVGGVATLNGLPIVTEAPIDGEDYTRKDGAWNLLTAAGVAVSETPPPNPEPEDFWFHSGTGRIYMYYQDPGSAQWVEIGPGVISQADGTTPIGGVVAYGGNVTTNLPIGFLHCNGQAVSQVQYSSLFAVIGTTFGDPGGGNFNLPDIQSRAIIGQGPGLVPATDGIDSTILGDTGGVGNHVLTSAQIPSHTHGAGSLVIGSVSDHEHNLAPNSGIDIAYFEGSGSQGFGSGSDDGKKSSSLDTGFAGGHNHSISGSTASAGSGGSHPNVQPSIVMHFIIRY